MVNNINRAHSSLQGQISTYNELLVAREQIISLSSSESNSYEELAAECDHLSQIFENNSSVVQELGKALIESGGNAERLKQNLRNITFSDGITEAQTQIQRNRRQLIGLFRDAGLSQEEAEKNAKSIVDTMQQMARSQDNVTKKANEHAEAVRRTSNYMEEAVRNSQNNITFGQAFTESARGLSQLTMGITSVKSAIDTLNNSDISFGEKLLSVTMSLSMGFPMLMNGITGLKSGITNLSSVFLDL